MVSGTIANKRRLKAAKSEELRNRLASAARTKDIAKNREEIIAEVCSLFGWKALDPFAKDMIDKALAGEFVDIKRFKHDIAAWKQSQEALEDTASTKEEANGDTSVQ